MSRRAMPPYIAGSDSVYFESFNRGKKSITLDIKRPDGRAVFEDLVARSDAVFSNLRGDQPERLRPALCRPRARSTRGSSASRCPATG